MTGIVAPAHGDVIVEKQPGGCYVLHIGEGPSQLRVESRQGAVAEAIAFAKRQRVRVWFAHGEQSFELLEDFRSATSL